MDFYFLPGFLTLSRGFIDILSLILFLRHGHIRMHLLQHLLLDYLKRRGFGFQVSAMKRRGTDTCLPGHSSAERRPDTKPCYPFGIESMSISSSLEKVLSRFGSSSLTTPSMRLRFLSMMAAIFSSRVPSVISLNTWTPRR